MKLINFFAMLCNFAKRKDTEFQTIPSREMEC